MRRACAGQLFGLLLIPTPVFGVDSTPRMGEWVGGWDGAIWGDFSSWTCPFPFGDMDWPISRWDYGPAPFPHLVSPSSPSQMRFGATRCIYVYREKYMRIHSACLPRSIGFFPSCLQTSLLFVMELSIGDRVFSRLLNPPHGLRTKLKCSAFQPNGPNILNLALPQM